MQCPVLTHERIIESCNWYAKKMAFTLLKEVRISFIPFLRYSDSIHTPESVQLLESEYAANTEVQEGQLLEFSLSSLYLLSYQVFPL